MFATARTLLLGAAIVVGALGPVSPLTVSAPAEISASKLGELEAFYDAAISPDGNKVAVILNMDGEHGLAMMDMSQPSNPPRLVSLGDKI